MPTTEARLTDTGIGAEHPWTKTMVVLAGALVL